MKRAMKRNRLRNGFMQLEIVVATGLLVVAISGLAKLYHQLAGVARDSKHYQLALHEVMNQIGLLQETPLEKLDQAVLEVKLPDEVLDVLPEAKLAAERKEDSAGTWVIVRMSWNRVGNPPPIELMGLVSHFSKKEVSDHDPE